MLIHTHDVANLARITLTEDEHQTFAKDIESILAFIDTIQELSVSQDTAHGLGMAPVGGMRDDEVIVRSGEFSSTELVAQAPGHMSNFIQVKKILN